MRFCPYCGTLLLVRQSPAAESSELATAFACKSCSYGYAVEDKAPIVEATRVRPKRPEEAAEKHDARGRTAATCAKCHHKEALFTQQVRGAAPSSGEGRGH